jgi:hypothetical protein
MAGCVPEHRCMGCTGVACRARPVPDTGRRYKVVLANNCSCRMHGRHILHSQFRCTHVGHWPLLCGAWPSDAQLCVFV